jgi:hypothetical protein
MTTLVAGLQGQPPADHPHGYPFLHSLRYFASVLGSGLFGFAELRNFVEIFVGLKIEPW